MSYYSVKRKNRKTAKKRAVIAVVLIMSIAILMGAAGIIFINVTLNRVNRAEKIKPIPRSEQDFETDGEGEDTISPEEVSWGKPDMSVINDKDIKNILLIGQDRREGQGRQRSDTMIICSINRRIKKITLVSLMRDMYVPITGYDDNRINATYAFGGMELLDQTIERNFGVHIDGNVEVDFEGFIKTMSQVGDLELMLTQEEADFINNKLKRGTLKSGKNKMDAEQILLYARIRKIGNGDYQRTERQRIVLQTAFAQLRQYDWWTIYSFTKAVLPNFTTDMTNRQIIGYVFNVFTSKMMINRDTYRLPIDGSYHAERIRGMDVLVPDLNENAKTLKWYLYGINKQ